MKNDFYEILNIEPEATITDIKKSFRKLSVKYHPDKIDKNLSDEDKININKQYELITLAFSVLSNNDLRREYDQLYYIEKRNEDFSTLKQNFKEYKKEIPRDKTFKQLEEEIISNRHTFLTDTYKPRTLEEYVNEREKQIFNVKETDNKSINEKQIITKLEPEAIIPASISNYQDINNLGEMYDSNYTNLNEFTIDNIDTNITEIDIDKSMEEYNKSTDYYHNLSEDKYEKKGSLIVDKIIVQK